MVEIEPVAWCTRRCDFCFPARIESRARAKIALTAERHSKLMRGLAEAEFDGQVVYCGQYSEPLLHEGIADFVREARQTLPSATVICYTNGDLANVERLNALSEAGLQQLIFDLYDDETADRFAASLYSSRMDPATVTFIDHVRTPPPYFSRGARIVNLIGDGITPAPCFLPASKLFMSAEGAWIICCEDYGHKTAGRFGTIDDTSPLQLNERIAFAQVRDVLKLPLGRMGLEPCGRCDRPSPPAIPRGRPVGMIQAAPFAPRYNRGAVPAVSE